MNRLPAKVESPQPVLLCVCPRPSSLLVARIRPPMESELCGCRLVTGRSERRGEFMTQGVSTSRWGYICFVQLSIPCCWTIPSGRARFSCSQTDRCKLIASYSIKSLESEVVWYQSYKPADALAVSGTES